MLSRARTWLAKRLPWVFAAETPVYLGVESAGISIFDIRLVGGPLNGGTWQVSMHATSTAIPTEVLGEAAWLIYRPSHMLGDVDEEGRQRWYYDQYESITREARA